MDVVGDLRGIETRHSTPLVHAGRTRAGEPERPHRIDAASAVRPLDEELSRALLGDLRRHGGGCGRARLGHGTTIAIGPRPAPGRADRLRAGYNTHMNEQTIAILGGTGDQGLGLALRFAAAGRPVIIGSRKLDRALEAADNVRKQVEGANVEGLENGDATAGAPIVILSVPWEHTASTVKGIRERMTPGQILVSMGVPLATAHGDAASRMVGVWQGSCAELVASLAPEGVATISAFQNVAAHHLQHLPDPVECDVVISGAKGPRERVMELCQLVPGLRAVNGGPLTNARIVESMTALLIGMNIRYKTPEGLGIRFTGLPD